MIALSDPGAARLALMGLAASAEFTALDAPLQAALLAAAAEVSVVDAVCKAAELMFARAADLGPLALGLGAGLAALALTNGWTGPAGGTSARMAGLMSALRREAGDAHPTDGAWPAPTEDPTPLEQYLAS